MISFRSWSQSLEQLEQRREIDAPVREKRRREWENFLMQLDVYGSAPLPRQQGKKNERLT